MHVKAMAILHMKDARAGVTGQLAGGQENHWGGRMSAFDPQDWWNGLGLGLVRYYLDS